LYFSVIGAIAFVSAELYGPRTKSTWSWLISRSTSCAPRADVDSSS
jgi:hypothetical protein